MYLERYYDNNTARMTEDEGEGWKSSAFRQRIVEQIRETQEECKSRVPLQKSAPELEELVFRRSLDKEMYLSLVARMILFLRTRASGSPPPGEEQSDTSSTTPSQTCQEMVPPYCNVGNPYANNWQPSYGQVGGPHSQYFLGTIKQERVMSPQSSCRTMQYGHSMLPEGVTKCQKLLSSLLTLMGARLNTEKRTALKQLVQQLLADKTTPENFVEELSKILKTPPQPHMIPFLKTHLDGLRTAIAQGLISIDGFNSRPKNDTPSWPAAQHGQVIPMNGTRVTAGSSSMPERRPRGRPPTKHLSSPLASSAGFRGATNSFSARNGDRLESQIRSLLSHKVSPLPSPQGHNGSSRRSPMTEPGLPPNSPMMQPPIRRNGTAHAVSTSGPISHNGLSPLTAHMGLGMGGSNGLSHAPHGLGPSTAATSTHPPLMGALGSNGLTHPTPVSPMGNNGSQRLRTPQLLGRSNGVHLPGMSTHLMGMPGITTSSSVIPDHFGQNMYVNTGMSPYTNSCGPLPEGAQELLALSSQAPADFNSSTMNMLMSITNPGGLASHDPSVTSTAAMNAASYSQSLADAECIVQREGKLLADLSFSRSSRPNNIGPCDNGTIQQGPSMWELGMTGGTYGPEGQSVLSPQQNTNNSSNGNNFNMAHLRDNRLLRVQNKSADDASFESLLLTELDVLPPTSSQHGEIS